MHLDLGEFSLEELQKDAFGVRAGGFAIREVEHLTGAGGPRRAEREILHFLGVRVDGRRTGHGADVAFSFFVQCERTKVEANGFRRDVHDRLQHPVEIERRADFPAELFNERQVT